MQTLFSGLKLTIGTKDPGCIAIIPAIHPCCLGVQTCLSSYQTVTCTADTCDLPHTEDGWAMSVAAKYAASIVKASPYFLHNEVLPSSVCCPQGLHDLLPCAYEWAYASYSAAFLVFGSRVFHCGPRVLGARYWWLVLKLLLPPRGTSFLE
jgi:hypothetical protein